MISSKWYIRRDNKGRIYYIYDFILYLHNHEILTLLYISLIRHQLALYTTNQYNNMQSKRNKTKSVSAESTAATHDNDVIELNSCYSRVG